MRLLLDSHILLAISLRRLPEVFPAFAHLLERRHTELWASAASLWEIAIKSRLGKLDPGLPLDALADFYLSAGIRILDVTARHAVAAVDPLPVTRDPFDRMLLAQCEVEGLRLVTLDGLLVDHPLALSRELLA
jgi:PIN domain nuclease of toxin-antitoxin system